MIAHALPPLRIVPHQFTPDDLCGGHVALDFVNTAAGLNRDPRDWLDSYARLIEWAELAGICDARLGRELMTLARAEPASGQDALTRVRVLRSSLYEILHSGRHDARPPDAAVDELQRWCRRGAAALTLHWDGVLRRSIESCDLDVIGVAVALAAADLLSQPVAGQVSVCGGRNCGWMFLNRSTSRRRRWCDMKTCGNAAKAGRHYERKRAAERVQLDPSP